MLDLYNWEGLRLWALLASAALIGTNVVAFFVILSRRRFKLAPLLALLAVTVVYVLGRLPHGSAIPVTSAAHNRMVLDATGILLGTFLGYRFFYGFISVEGVEQIRARTELELAHGIQRTLVPVTAIQIRNPSSKLCAESVAEVGCSLGHVGHESVSASGASVSQGHVFARDSRQNATGFVFRKADRSLVPRVSCLKCRCFVFVGSGAVGVFTIADPQAYLSTPERTDRRKPWTRSQ